MLFLDPWMCDRRRRLVTAVVAVCVTILLASAAQCDKASAEENYNFAVWLFSRGNYVQAISEFRRYEFVSDDPEASLRADYAVAACYQHANQWTFAIDAWRKYLAKYPNDPSIVEAAYRLGECMLAMGDYRDAGSVVKHYLKTAPETSDYLDDAVFLQGMIRLTQRHWREAESGFADFRAACPTSKLCAAAKVLEEAAHSLATMKRKTPAKAAVLSMFIPGLGQAYAGRPGDAWTSFLVNSAFFYFTVNRFDKGDQTAGYLLGAITLSFYAGNVYGAAQAASARNRADEEKIIKKALAEVQPLLSDCLGHPQRLSPKPLG